MDNIVPAIIAVMLVVLLWVWVTSRPFPTSALSIEDLGQQITAVLYLTLGITGTLAIWLGYLTYYVVE